MANHTLRDAVWTSDKLAAIVPAAGGPYYNITLDPGDFFRLLYPWLAVPQQDDWGCFELNPAVARVYAFGRFAEPPSVETIRSAYQAWNHAGLLFVWEQEGKAWCYLTGKEAGRLPEPSRRHRRKTPALHGGSSHKDGLPCERWPGVQEYLSTYNSLQPALNGLLTGYKVIQEGTPRLQEGTERLQEAYDSPTRTYELPSIRYILPTLARAGADPDLDPDPDPDPDLRSLEKKAFSASTEGRKESETTNRLQQPTKHLQEPTLGSQGGTHRPQQGTGRPQKGTNELQSTTGLKKKLHQLAGRKRLSNDGGNDSLRAHLMQGIYRKRLFATHDDAVIAQRRGTFKPGLEPIAVEVTNQCITLLLSNRGGVELRGLQFSELSERAWPQVKKALPVLAKMKDYERRKNQLGGHVMNCVVDAALAWKEAQR